MILNVQKNNCEFTRDGKVQTIGYRKNRLFEIHMQVLIPSSIMANVASGKSNSLQLWHHRLGHQNLDHVKSIHRKNNISIDNDVSDVCEGCFFGKQHRLPFQSSSNRAVSCGEVIYADICGPMEENSIGGSKYFLLLKDDFSRYKWVYFIKQKDEVKERIRDFLQMMENFNHSVVNFRSDNGTEFCNKTIEEILTRKGIQHHKTVPYTPEQNGCIEREIRTVVELARSILYAKGLPKKLWAEAVNYVVYTLNNSGPSSQAGKTPIELWSNKLPSIQQLRVFGCTAFCHVPKQLRRKLDQKSKNGIFVGYDNNSKGFRIYFDEINKIEIHRDVAFGNELLKNELLKIEEVKGSVLEVEEVTVRVPDNDVQTVPDNNKQNVQTEIQTQFLSSQEDDVEIISDRNTGCEMSESGPGNFIDSNEVQQVLSINPASTSRHNLRPRCVPIIDDMFLSVAENDEPSNYKEAVNSKYSEEWKLAMDEEYNALIKNKTWELCKLPDNRKLVDCRWVYKIKKTSKGVVERFKARLVARGFTQVYGLDYDETYSPVVKHESVRTLFAYAAQSGMLIEQFDIKTAFLYGELDEEIYMQQPPGYVKEKDVVCRLKRRGASIRNLKT